MKLYGRTVRLVVAPAGSKDGLDVSDLDIRFSVKKTLKPTPNTAEIHVYNLNVGHRYTLETAGSLNVELHAGYTEGASLLYLGEMRAAVTSQVGPDIITTIDSGDKHGNFAGKAIHVPVGAGTTGADALRLLADAFGLGKGNLEAALARSATIDSARNKDLKKLGLPAARPSMTLFPVGGVLSGNVAAQLTSICRTVGLEFWVEDGTLAVLPIGAALEDTATVLGPDTGLVGSISISNKGYVKARALLIPDLQVGRKVVFDTADNLKGGFRIEKAHYHGGTRDSEWYVDIEAKSY